MIEAVKKDVQAQAAQARANAAVSSPRELQDDWWSAPLCVRFATPTNQCDGCPVKEKTGRRFCVGTPRTKIEPALIKWEDAIARGTYIAPNAANYRKAVIAWADWLESL